MNLNKGLLSGHACRSLVSDVEVHFRNLEETLIQEINKADIIVGCIAWITSPKILEALVDKTVCLIVDRKMPRMNQGIKALYERIKEHPKDELYAMLKDGHGWREYFCYTKEDGSPIVRSVYGDWNFEAGIYMVDGGHYRYMHHKFLLLLKRGDLCSCGKLLYTPTVWTGSYNFTKNAKTGLENAVIIRQRGVAASYLCEWLEVFHNHATQLNITNLQALYRGWRDTNTVGYMPLCRRNNYFPLRWFNPCLEAVEELNPSI